jgi:hypothetical protein
MRVIASVGKLDTTADRKAGLLEHPNHPSRLARTVTLVAGSLMLKERAAHLVRVAGDNGVQAWPSAAPVASGDDGDAAPCLLRSELVARELGRQPAQLCW